jgi:hypothetical protein
MTQEKQWFDEAQKAAHLDGTYLRSIDYLRDKLDDIISRNRTYEQIAITGEMAKLLLDALEKY